ncbi:MAG TPA: hypothetical protein DHV12_00460 [Thermotogae bacterium]|nr:hypothetical protein [Thermotogota bacterium]
MRKTLLLIFVVFLTTFTLAMPPHYSLQDRVIPPHLPEHDITPRLGITFDPTTKTLYLLRAPKAPVSGSVRGVALLIDFSDKPHQVETDFFNDLFNGFGIDWAGKYQGNTNSGSVREFFLWSSGGTLDLTFDVYGWYRAPKAYSEYVFDDYGLWKISELVSDAIKAADPYVDFSRYDSNGDGVVDYFLLIHAGSGAEYTGSSDDIWSHQGWVSVSTDDGVEINKYVTAPELWEKPEDMTIGVYCHEIGHLFGLPDFYDTDGSSYGLGYWSLMAYGAWSGKDGMGGSPSGLDAWSKVFLGWAEPLVAGHHSRFDLAPFNEVVMVFKNADDTLKEYFLVEYRKKESFDEYLPGEGILIYHVDDDKGSNNQEWYPGLDPTNHYRVALEQSDGRWDLEHKANPGDETDVWKIGSRFTPDSTPSSNYYLERTRIYVEVEELTERAHLNVSTSLLGDFTGDGKVDAKDLALFSLHWGEDENSPNWDPLYDIGPREGFSLAPYEEGELIIETPRKVDEEDLKILIQLFGLGDETK